MLGFNFWKENPGGIKDRLMRTIFGQQRNWSESWGLVLVKWFKWRSLAAEWKGENGLGKYLGEEFFFNDSRWLETERVEAIKNNSCVTERRGPGLREKVMHSVCDAWVARRMLTGVQVGVSEAFKSTNPELTGHVCSITGLVHFALKKNPRCSQAFESKELIPSLSSPCVHITHSLPNSFSLHILEEYWYGHDLLVTIIH